MKKLWYALLFFAAGSVLIAGLAVVGAYLYVSYSLPRVDTLADYQPPTVTRVFSQDGQTIAEFYRERRIVVPVSRLPRQLIEAFVSAEDSHFFRHQGIDLTSILRAAVKNVLAGGIVQGGSTITQQVAKSLLLTPERKFSRKFKEAILAWKMEKSLTKEEILFLYLNQIYLGHGAHGVQAAAETYFAKDVQDLDLAECALLAGLPQAPSRYSPYQNLTKAKERQKYVLGRMAEEKYITREAADRAFKQPLTLQSMESVKSAGVAYFSEQVRRYLEEHYGAEQLYNGGLKVYTSMDLSMQQAAQEAVRDNLRDLDKRRGYRGPVKVLTEAEEEPFLGRQAEAFGKELPETGELLDAVLAGERSGSLLVRFGAFSGEIPTEQSRWAAPVRVSPRGTKASGNAGGNQTRLPIGSVLRVRLLERGSDGTWKLGLEQEPVAQGALVALDPHTGQVKAMVGGYDFGLSQFNRAVQARRLPGSAIKPIIYAAALDQGYTPATVILDTPVVYRGRGADGTWQEWKPKNYDDKFRGPTSVREALTHSLNVVTIKLLEDIGVGYVVNYARKLGIESPLNRDLTLALGSSAVTPLELATAYAVFANGGVRVTPSYITRVVDRQGRILESIDPADFPQGPGPGQRLVKLDAERVISPETAYLVTNLMESVVRDGTGRRAQALDRPVAGKTGTTNDLKDAWFAGFVPQLVAVTWVGHDQERPLGRGETGGIAAAPGWIAFMKKAVEPLPPEYFPVPDRIEFRPIDPETGLLALEDNPTAYIEAFAPGTAPRRFAMEKKKLKALDFFRLDFLGN